MNKNTYQEAGVDLDAAASIKDQIKISASKTLGPEVLTGVGSFGGMYDLSEYNEPVLVSSTDNVGTKLRIASLMRVFNTVGEDVVNQSVNDIIVSGAKPLFFLDYIATSQLIPQMITAIVDGVSHACKEAGCALIGGETAEMPGLYSRGHYDLAGFAVGVVEKKKLFTEDTFDLSGFIVGVVEKENILDTGKINSGDALLGLPSSGIHTNGYSLVRKVFSIDENPSILSEYFDDIKCKLGDALLEIHKPYYPLIKDSMPLVKGLAHITGGSFYKNVPRILPETLGAIIDTKSWDPLPIFHLIKEYGAISDVEMYRVFNMGIGMIIICAQKDIDSIRSLLPGANLIGRVIKQESKSRMIIT